MADSPTRTMRATRGRYEPMVELGRGATATVWRALDTRTGSDVALKRFHPHLVSDPVARRRIEDEAAAASRISHPNIVAAAELINDRDGLALVFPYVEGETLAARLAKCRRVAPRQAASIALDIADALTVAHSQGVVHRDVKPGNILLGADGRARLLDFGISHAVDVGQLAHDVTGAGMAIGTLPYMAPEQLAAEPTTPASDVYALGVVLYEMLAGRRPYAAASPVALASEQAQPPARIANAPGPLLDLALSAMAADIVARPDAAQLARGLSAWRDGRPEADAATNLVVAAAPRSMAPPRLGWLPAGVAAVALAVAVPVAASGVLTAQPDGLDLARSMIAHAAQPPVVSANDTGRSDRSRGGEGDKERGGKGKGKDGDDDDKRKDEDRAHDD